MRCCRTVLKLSWGVRVRVWMKENADLAKKLWRTWSKSTNLAENTENVFVSASQIRYKPERNQQCNISIQFSTFCHNWPFFYIQIVSRHRGLEGWTIFVGLVTSTQSHCFFSHGLLQKNKLSGKHTFRITHIGSAG